MCEYILWALLRKTSREGRSCTAPYNSEHLQHFFSPTERAYYLFLISSATVHWWLVMCQDLGYATAHLHEVVLLSLLFTDEGVEAPKASRGSVGTQCQLRLVTKLMLLLLSHSAYMKNIFKLRAVRKDVRWCQNFYFLMLIYREFQS